MDDLPDYLPGYPRMYGVKQELQKHYQGDKIVIFIPVDKDITNFKFRAYMADDRNNGKYVWLGNENNGVEVTTGGLNVVVKSLAAVHIPSGTYYLCVTGSGPKDIGTWCILGEATVAIRPSAGSPYPIINVGRPHYVTNVQSTFVHPVNLQWYDGINDFPNFFPTNTGISAFYCGANGTFYRWSVIDQQWFPVIE